jgi:hypothetical protein
LIFILISAVGALVAAYAASYPTALVIELACIALCAVGVFRAKRLGVASGGTVLIWALLGAGSTALFPGLAVARARREIARLEPDPSVY